ncbi:probable serine/threonine-protein kinase PBL18 [Salvia miltiorrhiza]|uniref:probable serine/threonine-protein kinase PBL18 n=1 Tax=Salvia miltiorrhiza TaxID=226208 RepID=UPI0025AD89B9|nr:probable serine/threonine-protein kinase PBL18 [Salvia miltiorrhiza]
MAAQGSASGAGLCRAALRCRAAPSSAAGQGCVEQRFRARAALRQGYAGQGCARADERIRRAQHFRAGRLCCADLTKGTQGPANQEFENFQNFRVFSFSELKQATNNFSRLLKIGEDGFGSVYKGTIKPLDGNSSDPTLVAIKKLNGDGFQGHKQWVAEVQFLGVVEIPNLVKLIGYCGVDGERHYKKTYYQTRPPVKNSTDGAAAGNLPLLIGSSLTTATVRRR